MKPSAAKTYLRSIRSEQREIRTLSEMRENIYWSLFPPAVRYDKDKVQTTPDDMVSKRMSRVCELDREIEKRIAELDAHRAEAFRMIQKIDGDNERAVLLLYYFHTRKNGRAYTWGDVAKAMKYSEDGVKKIHGKALIQFNELL